MYIKVMHGDTKLRLGPLYTVREGDTMMTLAGVLQCVLQCVAVCCSGFQLVTVGCIVFMRGTL